MEGLNRLRLKGEGEDRLKGEKNRLKEERLNG